jgi:type I restriction enzyme S subunit
MSFPTYPAYRDSGVAWLGRVPAGWSVRRLRFLADIRPSSVDKHSLEGELPVRLCNYVDVYKNDRITDTLAFLEATATPAEIERFSLRAGDVLITKDSETPDDIAAAALVEPSAAGVVCGYHLALLRSVPGAVGGAFLFWAFKAPETLAQCSVRAQGITRFGLSTGAFGDVLLPLPLPVEQRGIAAFLDRECGKIDALVAEQERLIALLKEKRQAVISHAVTKGLDPNAPMKDSGIEWLGQVPAHWTVTRVKAVSSFITSGPRGWSERIQDEGALFVQSGSLGDDLSIDFQAANRVAVVDDAEASRTRLREGDVLVCITGAKTGNVGFCATMVEKAYINQHLCLARPISTVRPAFLALTLKSHVGQRHFESAQYGLKQGLSLQDVADAPVTLPPPIEQERIVTAMARATTETGALITEAERAITLLKERRAALISAAVTGKIDVRGLVAAIEAEAA